MEQEKPWLRTRLLIEVAGFPEEHVNSTLNLVAEKFGKDVKEIKVVNKKVREAKKVSLSKDKPLEDSKFFSGFAEFEADVENLATVVGIIFDWMPSSIEITNLETVAEDIHEVNGVLNDLATRLHQYDSMVKALRAKNAVLDRELRIHKPKSDDFGSLSQAPDKPQEDKTTDGSKPQQ